MFFLSGSGDAVPHDILIIDIIAVSCHTSVISISLYCIEISVHGLLYDSNVCLVSEDHDISRNRHIGSAPAVFTMAIEVRCIVRNVCDLSAHLIQAAGSITAP